MSKLQFKYVRIQGKELARNTMYAKGVFSMCMQMIRDEVMETEDADTVAAAVREELSQTYDLYEETRELSRAGECLYLEASVLKGTNTMADNIQSVFIIPAPNGCYVATAHYAIEDAEGFGRRFRCMLDTFSVL